jgi:hypothetical protein
MRTVASQIVSALTGERTPCARVTVRDTLPRFSTTCSSVVTADGNLASSVTSYDADYFETGSYKGILRICNYNNTLYYMYLLDTTSAPAWISSGYTLKAGSWPSVHENTVYYQTTDGQVYRRDFYYNSAVDQGFGSATSMGLYDDWLTLTYALAATGTDDVWALGINSNTGEVKRFYNGSRYRYFEVPDLDALTNFDVHFSDNNTYVYYNDAAGRGSIKYGPGTRLYNSQYILPIDVVDDIEHFEFGYVSDVGTKVVATGNLKRDGYDGEIAMYLQGPYEFKKGRESIINDGSDGKGKLHEVDDELWYVGFGIAYLSDSTYLFGNDLSSRKSTTTAIGNISLSCKENVPDVLALDLPWSGVDLDVVKKGSELVLEIGYEYSGTNYYATIGTYFIESFIDTVSPEGNSRHIVARSIGMWRMTRWIPDANYEFKSSVQVESADPSDRSEWVRRGTWGDVEGLPEIQAGPSTGTRILYAATAKEKDWYISGHFDPYGSGYWGIVSSWYSHSGGDDAIVVAVSPTTYWINFMLNSYMTALQSGNHGLTLTGEHKISLWVTDGMCYLAIDDLAGNVETYVKLIPNFSSHANEGYGYPGFRVNIASSYAPSGGGYSALAAEVDDPSEFSADDEFEVLDDYGRLVATGTIDEVGADGSIPASMEDMEVADGAYYGGSQPWANSAAFSGEPSDKCIWLVGPDVDGSKARDAYNGLYLKCNGRLMKITDYDWSAPQSWEYTVGQEDKAIGDLTAGSWVNNRRRIWGIEMGDDFEALAGDTCDVVEGISFKEEVNFPNAPMEINVPTGNYVRISKVNYTSFGTDLRIVDLIRKIARLAGVDGVTYELEYGDEMAFSNGGAWALATDRARFSASRTSVNLTIDGIGATTEIGVCKVNPTTGIGSMVTVQDGPPAWVRTYNINTVTNSVTLVDTDNTAAFYYNSYPVRFSVSPSSALIYVGDTLMSAVPMPTTDEDETEFFIACKHTDTVDLDWAVLDDKIDWSILDMDRSALQNLKEFIGPRRIWLRDNPDGTIHIGREGDTIWTEGSPYSLGVTTDHVESNEELTTRAKLVGVTEVESYDFDAIIEDGNYFRYMSAPEIDEPSALERELENILDDSVRTREKFSLRGAFDPRLEKNDDVWVEVEKDGSLETKRLRVRDFSIIFSRANDTVVLDMKINGGEVVE